MNKNLGLLLILGIWIGMLIGISFVEAPLKFKAANITVPLGLGIGKLVFAALNKFEIFFSLLLISWFFNAAKGLSWIPKIAIVVILWIVLLQTIYLLPTLAMRADRIIKGEIIAESYHHSYYVALELIKLVLLVYAFVKIYHYERYSG